NYGLIKVELFQTEAPETVKNFLEYASAKHYNGAIFHRVIADFMIQGGGFDADMTELKSKAPIKNESGNGLANAKYTIAVAGATGPHRGTCQFFINTKDNPFLDKANAVDSWGYCAFGKVIAGQDVVDKIRKVPTEAKNAKVGGNQVPLQDVPV